MPPAPEVPSWALPSRHEERIFRKIAEAILPDPSLREPEGETAGALDRLNEMLARAEVPDVVALRLLLRSLDTHAGGLFFHGEARRVSRMSSVEIEAALIRMTKSRSSSARQAAKTLRAISVTLLGWPRRDRRRTRVWDAMGYPGPLGPPPETPPRLAPVEVTQPTTWSADVVIVGSGAGGGVAAGVLAKAGLDVVVLERGGYSSERDFTHFQDDADRDLYDTRFTSDLGVTLLSGKTLGGGTVVNYTTSLSLPPDVRVEWDEETGYRGAFTGTALERSFSATSERIGVTRLESRPWARDRVIEGASKKLGWSVEDMPRNVRGCLQDERCGYCNYGCRTGAKQSTMRTWLEDAQGAGARLVTGANAEQVIVEAGRAVGVRAFAGHGKSRVPLTVFAKAVVVAGGSLFTPILLRRSGVALPALGRFLRLHPVTGVFGRMDEPTDPWGGVMQARIGTQFANLDGRGYGIRFESGSLHPIEFFGFQGWGGGADFSRVVRQYRHWNALGVVLRDQAEGRVEVPRRGRPSYHYTLDDADVRHVKEGIRRAVEALVAVGAREIRSCTTFPITWRPGGGEPLDRFLARIESHGFGALETSYGSFHQMGTARIGKNDKTSVVDAHHEVHGVRSLFVMDASVFPTASGVNPMLTIEALAHRAATDLAARLGASAT